MFPERKIYFRKMFPKRKKRRPLEVDVGCEGGDRSKITNNDPKTIFKEPDNISANGRNRHPMPG